MDTLIPCYPSATPLFNCFSTFNQQDLTSLKKKVGHLLSNRIVGPVSLALAALAASYEELKMLLQGKGEGKLGSFIRNIIAIPTLSLTSFVHIGAAQSIAKVMGILKTAPAVVTAHTLPEIPVITSTESSSTAEEEEDSRPAASSIMETPYSSPIPVSPPSSSPDISSPRKDLSLDSLSKKLSKLEESQEDHSPTSPFTIKMPPSSAEESVEEDIEPIEVTLVKDSESAGRPDPESLPPSEIIESLIPSDENPSSQSPPMLQSSSLHPLPELPSSLEMDGETSMESLILEEEEVDLSTTHDASSSLPSNLPLTDPQLSPSSTTSLDTKEKVDTQETTKATPQNPVPPKEESLGNQLQNFFNKLFS